MNSTPTSAEKEISSSLKKCNCCCVGEDEKILCVREGEKQRLQFDPSESTIANENNAL